MCNGGAVSDEGEAITEWFPSIMGDAEWRTEFVLSAGLGAGDTEMDG